MKPLTFLNNKKAIPVNTNEAISYSYLSVKFNLLPRISSKWFILVAYYAFSGPIEYEIKCHISYHDICNVI